MWLDDPDLARHPQQRWNSMDRQGTGGGGYYTAGGVVGTITPSARPAGPAAPAPSARTAPAAKPRPKSGPPPGEPGGSSDPQDKPGTSDPKAPQYRARINGKDIPGGPLPSTSQVQGRNGVPAPGHNQAAQQVSAQTAAPGGDTPMAIISRMMNSGNPQLMQMASMLLPAMLASDQFMNEGPVRDLGMAAQSAALGKVIGGGAIPADLRDMIEAQMKDIYRQSLLGSGISPGTIDQLDLVNMPNRRDLAMQQEREASSIREEALRSWIEANGVIPQSTRSGETYYTRNGRFFAGPQDIARRFGPVDDRNVSAAERTTAGRMMAEGFRKQAADSAGIQFDPENPSMAFTLDGMGNRVPVELAYGTRGAAVPYKYDW